MLNWLIVVLAVIFGIALLCVMEKATKEIEFRTSKNFKEKFNIGG